MNGFVGHEPDAGFAQVTNYCARRNSQAVEKGKSLRTIGLKERGKLSRITFIMSTIIK
jgi:hypothetical protein